MSRDSTNAVESRSMLCFNVLRMAEEKAHELRAPVCNTMLCNVGSLRVMLIGGPNQRTDYHYNRGEELFYQLRGDMVLKVMEQGAPKDIPIREGEIFLLPRRIPHSPQRMAHTLGVVVERARFSGELDGLCYYTGENNDTVLWRRFLPVTDLSRDLKPVMEAFMSSDAHRTGVPESETCAAAAPYEADIQTVCRPPAPPQFCSQQGNGAGSKTGPVQHTAACAMGGGSEFQVIIVGDGFALSDSKYAAVRAAVAGRDVLVWLHDGAVQVSNGNKTYVLREAFDMAVCLGGVDEITTISPVTRALLVYNTADSSSASSSVAK